MGETLRTRLYTIKLPFLMFFVAEHTGNLEMSTQRKCQLFFRFGTCTVSSIENVSCIATTMGGILL